MSLVSPLERKNTQAIDDAVNVTSGSTSASTASYQVPNVYQVEGKPLSREALYKAKLKYGFYQSPAAKTGTGVVDSKQSSNKAASLAATSLSEKERVKQEELNKRLTPEQQYKRLLVGPDASKIAALHSQASESTASSSTTITTTTTTSNSTIFDNESLKKAAKKATRGSVTKELPTKINKGELNISKVLVGAEKNASERLASFSGNTKEDVTTAAFNKGQLNISKVLVGAEKRANERINNASGGVKNQVYNYYIKTPVELQQNKDEFRHKILGKGTPELYAGANKAAVEAVGNFSEGFEYHISEKNEKFASNAAGNALELSNQRALAEKARNDIYVNATTHEKVLQLARESVLKQMNELDFEATTRRDPAHILFNNDQFNRAAVDYILKKHDAKMQREQFLKGKVDVGGGLLLTQVELDEIAKKLVDPYLTEISDKASKQRERDIVILNEFQHNKETTKTFKETRREQKDREKARTEFERKHKKEESKLNKHLVNIEQTGALVNVPDLLAQIKGHNDDINNILQDDEVLNGKIDSFKQDIEAHETQIGELGQELESKRNERKTLVSAVSDVSGAAEDSENPSNKYDIQSLDNDIVLKEARESKEKALLLIKQKNLENHVKDLELNDKVKETLQKQIDLKLAKLETLKGLGTESKDKYNALDKLREENKINLTSRHLYIRSTFGKDLDAMIKEEQEKYEREEAEKAAEKAAERAAQKAAAAPPLSSSENTVPEAEEGEEKEEEEEEEEEKGEAGEEKEGEAGEEEEEVKTPESTELHGSVVPAEEHIEVHPAVEESVEESVEKAAEEAPEEDNVPEEVSEEVPEEEKENVKDGAESFEEKRGSLFKEVF